MLTITQTQQPLKWLTKFGCLRHPRIATIWRMLSVPDYFWHPFLSFTNGLKWCPLLLLLGPASASRVSPVSPRKHGAAASGIDWKIADDVTMRTSFLYAIFHLSLNCCRAICKFELPSSCSPWCICICLNELQCTLWRKIAHSTMQMALTMQHAPVMKPCTSHDMIRFRSSQTVTSPYSVARLVLS